MQPSSVGKFLTILLTIALVLVLNGVAVGYLLLYLGGTQALLYFAGYFESEWRSPMVVMLERLNAKIAEQSAT